MSPRIAAAGFVSVALTAAIWACSSEKTPADAGTSAPAEGGSGTDSGDIDAEVSDGGADATDGKVRNCAPKGAACTDPLRCCSASCSVEVDASLCL
jgi:hypothetical protein